MFTTLHLSLQDLTTLSNEHYSKYTEKGSILVTTKEKLLRCNLTQTEKLAVESLPNNIPVKLESVEFGTFKFVF